MGWPHWRAVGCWVPSSAPPRPPGASSRRCGRRALAAHPLVVAVPSGSGPWGAEPADVSPGFPTPGASPSPAPSPAPERAPEWWEWGDRLRDPQRRGDWRGSSSGNRLPVWHLQMGKPGHGPLAGSVGSPGLDHCLSVRWGVWMDRFWGVCGSCPGRAVEVQASLMACSAFFLSVFPFPG